MTTRRPSSSAYVLRFHPPGLWLTTAALQLNNHLETAITLLSVKGAGSQDGTQYAYIDYTLANTFTTQPGEAPGAYGEKVPLTLTKGALASLALFAPENQAKGLDVVRTFHTPGLRDPFADSSTIGYRQRSQHRPVLCAIFALQADAHPLQCVPRLIVVFHPVTNLFLNSHHHYGRPRPCPRPVVTSREPAQHGSGGRWRAGWRHRMRRWRTFCPSRSR